MELFRNVGIRARIILTSLLVVVLPVFVFFVIRSLDLSTNTSVFFFLGSLFLLISLLSSYLVAVSITKPLDRIRRRLSTFVEKRAGNPVNDHGEDEVAEVSREVDNLFQVWNQEIGNLQKKHKATAEEKTRITASQSDLQRQLGLSKSCLAIAQRLNTTFDFQSNLKTILDEAVKTMNVQWASILLINRDTLEMTVACVRGVEQSLLDDLNEDQYPAIKLKPNEGLAGQVIKAGVPLVANKGHKDTRFKNFSEFRTREERVASLLCSPIKSSDGTVLGVMNFVNRISPPLFRNEDLPFSEDLCLLVSLVTERNRLFRSLFADEVTGLTSHKVWREYYTEEVNRSVRYSQPLAITILDIDRFKDIVAQSNPEFGLKMSSEIGIIIKKALRDTDLASRVQDRFYLLLVNTDAAGAMYLIGRIKEVIEKMAVEHGGKTLTVTLSAGVSSFPETGPDARNLLDNALKALEQAKAAGRDRAMIYGKSTSA